jgi:hypothetical protein
MDKIQIIAFTDYAIGDRVVGSSDGEALTTPHSPELRAFIVARLGEDTPHHAGWLIHRPRVDAAVARQAKAFAALLREVADGIDPPEKVA